MLKINDAELNSTFEPDASKTPVSCIWLVEIHEIGRDYVKD
jgi:hypothetical protein